MSRTTPEMRSFAEDVLACALASNPGATASTPAGFVACDRLRPHLTALMGSQGFQALLSRALGIAAVRVAWLQSVRVTAEGLLEARPPLGASIDTAEGSVVLVAELLGLLVAFIGEDLTLRFVREEWPALSPRRVET